MEHTSDQILKLLDDKTNQFKSPQQLVPLVYMLFGNPHTLIEKIHDFGSKNIQNRHKQFDLQSIRKIYEAVKKHKLQKEIAKSYMQVATKFQQPGRLQQFVKSQKEMRFFFIVIQWEQLFTQAENSLLLLKMLNLINSCPGYAHTFQSWCKQIDQHYLTLMVGQLHKYLERQCQKLPNFQTTALIPEDNDYINKLWLNISNIGKFMKILYHSNLQLKRVPKEIFILPTFSKYFDSTMQYKLHYHKKTKLNMLSFPFLMSLDYKYQLIRIQSVLEQKLNIQRSMSTGFSGMLNAMIQNNDFSLEGLIYLYIEVNRHDILNDSMEKLNKVKNLKAPLRISFVGEEGADEGGVKNQYFQLITKAIFNPYLDMFLPKHNGRVYWFNGFSYQPPIRFQFVGMLLGLAIYNSVHLQIPFPNVLYKKLLNKTEDDEYSPELLNDLHDIEPEVSIGLKKILQTTDPLQDLQLYFTIELQSFGQKIVQELVEDGRQIKVTQDNKQQYCQLYADYLLNKHISKQFTAFKKGFYKVVSGKMIELLDSENLKTIIYGNDVIDFQELQETTSYQGGYTKDTPIIKNFWEILHSLDLEDKKAFLVFATGSDRVPIQGMKELNFVIQRHANTSNLPTAHTCFNVFLLPEYETREKLEKMIHLILKNNQGFGLI